MIQKCLYFHDSKPTKREGAFYNFIINIVFLKVWRNTTHAESLFFRNNIRASLPQVFLKLEVSWRMTLYYIWDPKQKRHDPIQPLKQSLKLPTKTNKKFHIFCKKEYHKKNTNFLIIWKFSKGESVTFLYI